ncbi:MAG: adenylate/guanylate cyclase domain-containing protein [Thermodesulfobacteriota bacterium]
MKCPDCGFENPDVMKFCGRCGNKLEIACARCGFGNAPNFKFCVECGNKLASSPEPPPRELSVEEKLVKMKRFLPKGLAEKVLSQREKIEGERKQVTVLFCDMKDYTSLSEKLGAEAVYSMMDQVYEVLIHRVHDYGGTVNEMTGDGIMALFGAPVALEDAPQRAIRSAVAIHREMTRLNERLKQEKGDLPPIRMRIGIHTGPVVVGTLGNDLRIEFKAVGDTVILASRMESLAEPGTTYVSHDTFRLTEGFFRFEALGEREIKGRGGPVKVYQVIAPSRRRTRFDVSAERGLTPFVGRERELELLLDGFERSKEGRGQAISIISDAGVGKSRLLYEFRKAVSSQNRTFLEGRCLSYSRNIAYHPLVDVLKATFEVEDYDMDQAVRDKVSRGLKAMQVDEVSTLPFLLDLLAVKESGLEKTSMSPEARKERTMEAMKRVVLKGADFRPLIVAVEDLHWMDRSSEDAFKALLESISASRVLLIFTYRPEFIHTWGSRSYHSQVTLNRLSNRESLAMATHILGTPDLERDLEDLILQKTEGIPFFIEEFIKSLKDLGVIARMDDRYGFSKDIRKLTIPATIQDVIMARVDNLPQGAREVLRTGSVIEREFRYDLIKRVTAIPEQKLLSCLSSLKDSELLYERGVYPESTFIFKHALTREVAYESILAERKKELHERVGNAIEDLYKDSAAEHYGVLVEHYFLSENYIKAAEYCRLAARKAENAGFFPDAIGYAEKRLKCLEKLPHTPDLDRTVVDARTALGLYYIQMVYHDKAKEVVEPVVELAEKIADGRRLAQIYAILGSHSYLVEENYDKAFQYFEKSLALATQSGDTLSLWMAHFWLGLVFIIVCQFEKALHHLDKALDMNIKGNVLWGVSVLKSIIASWVYGFNGEIERAYRTSKEALQMAEENQDVFSGAYAYFSHGCACYYMGLFEEAEQHLLRGIQACEKIECFSLESMTKRFLADTHLEMGRCDRSEQLYLEAIALSKYGGFMPSFVNLYELAVARIKARSGKGEVDMPFLYEVANLNKVKFNDGLIAAYLAEILMNMGGEHLEEAERWIARAVEADSRNRTRWNLARDYQLQAELFMRRNANARMKEAYGKAIQVFSACGAQGWVRKAEAQLEEFLQRDRAQ